MTEQFTSPLFGSIFGPTRKPTEEEEKEVQKLVDEIPVTVFQKLNGAFNERGLFLRIMAMEEQEH